MSRAGEMCLQYRPEGFALHVLIRQAVIGERLVPRGVAGVSQGLCAQLRRLFDAEIGILRLFSPMCGYPSFLGSE